MQINGWWAMTDTKQYALEKIKYWGWYEWTVHTNFSFLMGASYPHEYLERALSLGYRGMGVSDLDGVYGLARTHRDLKKLLKQEVASDLKAHRSGFKIFYGMELHMAPDHHLPMVFRDTVILVAQSREGYSSLCRLASEAHRLRGKTGAYLTLDEMKQGRTLEGVVAIQPMRGILRRREKGREERLKERFRSLSTLFPGRFYLALSCHLSPAEDLWIAPTLAMGKELGLPFLLDQDVFFHEPRRKMMSDLLQSIRQNVPLDQAVPFMFTNHERSFKSLEALAFRYGSLPVFERALENSARLADSINWSFDALSYRYPREMLPLGKTAQGFLTELVWDHARQHYKEPLPQKVASLLEHELQLIETLNFADYFLTVWDIVRWARSQGILCQGRGSAANSAVCFVLGVTSVDPMLFDLLFERFMSVERGDPPDIDVDFEHERREEVIQYIYQRYGRHRAAMVANVITFRTKGSIRAVGKALGVSEKLLGEVSQRLEFQFIRRSGAQDALRSDFMEKSSVQPEWKDHGEPKTSLDGISEGARRAGYGVCQRALAENKEARQIPWKLWWDLAEELKGFPRHLGIHSGGFMLADEPLDCLVAQEPATMEGRSVVQWSKEDIEGLGFFKIDILALGMLSALQKGFQGIKAIEGRELHLATIPQEDPATYAMIQRADTVGTFQIESRAQMSMLPRLRPRTFYDLVVEVAIIRPGPIQGGMIHPYLKRREGQEPVVFPDERLRPILARTLGIPLFQEQVMRIAMAVGGFTPGEANELRRHMGAWSLKGDMGPWLTRLAEGMRREGIAEAFVESILGQMKGFADYGFPESHAVSFALIAYASSWMKCHYPAVFYMALLNSQPMGFYTPHSLVQAAQRQGVKVLPISVQHSQWENSLELVAGGGKASGGSPPLYGIRLGLQEVRSLRKTAALHIIQCRQKEGLFSI
jgi:error-prone DNA polymerase